MSIINAAALVLATIHFEHRGACITATADKQKIDDLKAMAALHHIKVKPGDCANPPVKCQRTAGYRICGSVDGDSASEIVSLWTTTQHVILG